MGTTAARKARLILKNTQDVLAYELLTACQAIDIRRTVNSHGHGMTALHEAIYGHVRGQIDFMDTDREIWPDLRKAEQMVRSGELLHIAAEYFPEFK